MFGRRAAGLRAGVVNWHAAALVTWPAAARGNWNKVTADRHQDHSRPGPGPLGRHAGRGEVWLVGPGRHRIGPNQVRLLGPGRLPTQVLKLLITRQASPTRRP